MDHRPTDILVRFREANKADAERIAALHATSWRFAYRGMLSDKYLDGDLVGERTRLWIERLAASNPLQRVVLAEIGDRLAGFACAFGSEDPQLGTLLDNLHVRQEFQHQGVGTGLMNEIVSRVRAEFPGEGLFLWVLESNKQARRFYEDLGAIRVAEEIWHSPDGGWLPSLCYAWHDLIALMSLLKVRMQKPVLRR